MAWNLQSNFAVSPSNGNVLAYNGNVSQGTLLIAEGNWFNGSGPSSVTDTAGNTWTQIGSDFSAFGSNADAASVWYAISKQAGPLTVTLNGMSAQFFGVTLVEFTGNGSAPLDTTSQTSSQNGTTMVAAGVTTSVDNELVLGCFYVSAPTTLPTTPWIANATINPRGGLMYGVFSHGTLAQPTQVQSSSGGGGYASWTASFLPSPDVTSIAVVPGSVTFPATGTGTVTLTAAAPSGGIVVSLSSSDPTIATVPATVTVLQGNTSAQFTVTSVNKTGSVTISATVTATVNAPFSVTSVSDIQSLAINPGTILPTQTAIGTVTLSQAAGVGGSTVSLVSLNTSVVTVPASVVVPQGQTTVQFAVTPTGFGSTSVHATVISTVSANIAVQDSISTVVISPSPVEFPTIAMGVVTLAAPALFSSITINLSSGDTTIATVPATVTVPQGSSMGNFVVTPQNKTGSTTITASSAQVGSGNAPISVIAAINTPAPPPKLSFSKRTTAAAAMFPCIFIASPQGAQAITSVVSQISALSLAYSQLINIYPALIHQDTANNDADLDVQINAAVTAVTNLNTIVQGLTVSSPSQGALAQMQIVVANALQSLLNAQANESLPDPD